MYYQRNANEQYLQKANRYTDAKTNEMYNKVQGKSNSIFDELGNLGRDAFKGLIEGPEKLLNAVFKRIPTIIRVAIFIRTAALAALIIYQLLRCCISLLFKRRNNTNKSIRRTLNTELARARTLEDKPTSYLFKERNATQH